MYKQWPEVAEKNSREHFIFNRLELKSILRLKNDLEKVIYNELGLNVLLFPSARSAIGTLLRYFNFNRDKTVYIPPYSSTCLYKTISPYSNISTILSSYFDMILLVHKWGYSYKIPDLVNTDILVSDSCDSFLGPNMEVKNDFEVVSLSKTIGTPGGMLLLRNARDYNQIKDMFNYTWESIRLGVSQANRRAKSRNSITLYEEYEPTNNFVTFNDLSKIKKRLFSYWTLREKLLSRKQKLSLVFPIIESSDPEKIGPVICIPLSSFKNEILNDVKNNFLIRKFDATFQMSSVVNYSEVLLFPIHRDIDDDHFKYLFNLLQKLST